MGSICPCLSPAEEQDEAQLREIAIGKDIDNRKSELIYVLYHIIYMYKESKFAVVKLIHSSGKFSLRSTQPVQTLFLFKSIWIHPQRSQGCQKMCQDPLNMPFEVWCANIAPERHKLRKTVRIGKKMSKITCFLRHF